MFFNGFLKIENTWIKEHQKQFAYTYAAPEIKTEISRQTEHLNISRVKQRTR